MEIILQRFNWSFFWYESLWCYQWMLKKNNPEEIENKRMEKKVLKDGC